ncbi:MAG: tetraacyldisaccharide 4'-kinase, partial [Pseudomonadota bacterium]|nr:tetraacyldisaccharide 4'-kinase [Pseudomonadota bacterium]
LAQRSLAGTLGLEAWWQGRAAGPDSFASLRGRPVLAVAGVARPERFFAMLREAGVDIVPLSLADHCDYAVLPWPSGTTDVVVTEKDAVKLEPSRVGGTRVWVAALDFVPAATFDAEVLRLLGPATPTTFASTSASAHGNSTA